MHFIQKYIFDYHAAEDISQEVFVYLLKHKDVYDSKYPFRTYLYTIAKSRALNYIKSKKKYVYIEDNPDCMRNEQFEVEEEIFRKEENRNVRRNLKKIKSDYQAAIDLVDFKGMTYDETAVILGKSMSQVKALLHNGRRSLKDKIEEENGVKSKKKSKKEIKEEVKHDEIDGRVHK